MDTSVAAAMNDSELSRDSTELAAALAEKAITGFISGFDMTMYVCGCSCDVASANYGIAVEETVARLPEDSSAAELINARRELVTQ
ncbi:hypothetical protein [Saccharomonospora piscinae]|uniref:hypothetical protein n=1 Tax=Saccharomonospora piscinae TaxID=687388 RepID=UPI0004B1DFD0|nr:hypothetical protein [Saccharomonospora piscinae]TLW91583.1 hypothetical protein FFT09_11565 [Saccharomonospora piscinae]